MAKKKELTKAEIKAKAIESKRNENKTLYTELKDVVDVRNGQFHSVAITKNESNFVPVEDYTE